MARSPSISSIQDFERARLASQPSTETPPFGPPYSNGTPRTSLSDSGSEEGGSHTPGADRRPSHRDEYYAGRQHNGDAATGDGWGEEEEDEEEDGEEEFGLDGGGGMASPPPNEDGAQERRGLRGMLLKAATRSSPARP